MYDIIVEFELENVFNFAWCIEGKMHKLAKICQVCLLAFLFIRFSFLEMLSKETQIVFDI